MRLFAVVVMLGLSACAGRSDLEKKMAEALASAETEKQNLEKQRDHYREAAAKAQTTLKAAAKDAYIQGHPRRT